MVNPTGYTALDLIGFTDKGTYSSSDNYVKNDLVHYSGNIWRCLTDDTSGIAPAEGVNWILFIGEPTNLVERIIAPVETDPATNAWAVGRQIIFNDNLYEVITAITAGDSLVTYEDDPANANIKLADPVETQLLNVKGNLSNRNLLDNAWFTVNQRGKASYTGDSGEYTVDRWRRSASASGGHTLTVGNVNLPLSKANFYQVWSDTDLVLKNEPYTISVIIDGNIYSKTFTPYGDSGSEHTWTDDIGIDGLTWNIREHWDAGKHLIGINNGAATQDHVITAIKLEKGSFSTLAQDSEPNYQQELAKCQRYFQRIKIKTNYAMLGLARAVSATSAQGFISPTVPLRALPSLTVGNISSLSFFARSTSYSISNIVMGTGSYNDSDVVGFQLQFTSSGLTTDDLLSFAGNDQVGTNAPYLNFSADL